MLPSDFEEYHIWICEFMYLLWTTSVG